MSIFKYSLYIFQVYLPSANHRISVYREHVELLYNIVSMYSQLGIVILMGDFNAHLNGPSFIKHIVSRGAALCDLINLFNLSAVTTLPICTGADVSYVSYDGHCKSFIDHVIVSSEFVNSISTCCVLDDNCLNVSNHRPIIFNIQCAGYFSSQANSHHKKSVKWHKITNDHITSFKYCMNSCLQSDVDQRNAADVYRSIDNLYESIVSSIEYASRICLPNSSYRPYLKPYWSAELRRYHVVMRYKRRVWIESGRPRGNDYTSYSEYKEAKRQFRKLHRNCSCNYLQEINRNIDAAADIDSPYFWRLFNSKRKNN